MMSSSTVFVTPSASCATVSINGRPILTNDRHLYDGDLAVRQHPVASRYSTGPSLGPLHTVGPYIAPLAIVTKVFGIHHHQYENNTHLNIFVSKKDRFIEVRIHEKCTDAIYDWLSHNGLTLNLDKSEAIRISVGSVQQNSVPIDTISVAGASIKLVDFVKSLCVNIDKCLSFDDHVAAVSKAYFPTCGRYVTSKRRFRMAWLGFSNAVSSDPVLTTATPYLLVCRKTTSTSCSAYRIR